MHWMQGAVSITYRLSILDRYQWSFVGQSAIVYMDAMIANWSAHGISMPSTLACPILPSAHLGSATLLELWSWGETQFNQRHEGSAIWRIGYSRWRRNLAIALGNALASDLDKQSKEDITNQLQDGLQNADLLVTEHITWALEQSQR